MYPLALREEPPLAVRALAAGDVVIDLHPRAARVLVDARAELGDDAGHLVAEDARRRHGAVVDLLQVRPADAAARDLDEELARPALGTRDVLDADVTDPAVDGGAHQADTSLAREASRRRERS